jgi:hypothetical protein
MQKVHGSSPIANTGQSVTRTSSFSPGAIQETLVSAFNQATRGIERNGDGGRVELRDLLARMVNQMDLELHEREQAGVTLAHQARTADGCWQ